MVCQQAINIRIFLAVKAGVTRAEFRENILKILLIIWSVLTSVDSSGVAEVMMGIVGKMRKLPVPPVTYRPVKGWKTGRY